jgi:hypothetical protein
MATDTNTLITQFTTLKKRVADLADRKNRLLGQQDQILTRLAREHGAKDIQAAKKLQTRKALEIEKASVEAGKALSEATRLMQEHPTDEL